MCVSNIEQGYGPIIVDFRDIAVSLGTVTRDNLILFIYSTGSRGKC